MLALGDGLTFGQLVQAHYRMYRISTASNTDNTWYDVPHNVPVCIPISIIGMVLHVDTTQSRLFFVERHLFFRRH